MAKKPQIFVTQQFPDAVMARVERDYDARLNDTGRVPNAEEIVSRTSGCDAIFCAPTEKFTADVIGRLPESVRLIATFSVGVDHIDLAAAKARGIAVTNTPDVLTDATADITLLLILAAARRAYEGERMVREDRWVGWDPKMLMGIEVTGKRLGILGMGRIGQAVARRASGFSMEVHYHNRKRLPKEQEQGAIYHETADGLLPHCDFLSINAPATAENYHFLNQQRIALLPDGAVVVNTARGTLVDDDALISALKSGKIAAAGLDVFEGEPRINPGYRNLENVFLLPHLGSATIETRNAMGFKCLDNLDAFFAGRPLPDRLV